MGQPVGDRFKILTASVFPVYSFYQLSNIAIVTLYTLDKGKKEVPTLVFEKGGTLYDFFVSDFKAIAQDALGQKIYPPIQDR